jgi:hypothetical protein
MEFQDIAAAAVTIFCAIGSVLGVANSSRKKGEFDLKKSIQAAKDVSEAVRELRRLGKSPSEATSIGADMVEGIRDKKLSKKLRRKVKAHLFDQLAFARGESLGGLAKLTGHPIPGTEDEAE